MMNRRLSVLVFVGLLGSLSVGLACEGRSTAARRAKMVREFVAVLPDSLDSEHRLEIQQLFNLFYQRADQGLVAKEDVKKIEDEAQKYIHRGRIVATDLVHFMAEVGYTTYKGDPNYNLPDSTVDHPILNPSSAMYSLRFPGVPQDSSFWRDYEKWRKEHEGWTDSMFLDEMSRQPARIGK